MTYFLIKYHLVDMGPEYYKGFWMDSVDNVSKEEYEQGIKRQGYTGIIV